MCVFEKEKADFEKYCVLRARALLLQKLLKFLQQLLNK